MRARVARGNIPMSQRDAMRHAVMTHGHDIEACIRYWLNEYEDGNVVIEGSSRSDPELYARRLYADGVAKGWI